MYHTIMRSVSATNRPTNIMDQIIRSVNNIRCISNIRSIGKNAQQLRQWVSSYIGNISYKGYKGYIGFMRYIDIICYICIYAIWAY